MGTETKYWLFESVSPKGIPWVLLSVVAGLIVLNIVTSIIYNLYFHPLAKYPGPAYAAATSLSYWAVSITGDLLPWIQRIHAQHPNSPVVRLGPNKLSFITPQAWRDIYGAGSTTAAGKSNPKDRMHYIEEKYGILAIHDDERHARVRRIFAPAFSDRALRRQEAMIVGYADMLVTAIARASSSSSSSKEEEESLAQPVDMCKLWTCATFDIMGKLTFGEPLGMLEAGEFTPWVRAVFAWNKAIDLSRLTLEYPVLDWLAKRLTPPSLVEMERMHHAHSADRVDRRLELGSDEPDIWNLILSAEEKGNGGLDKKDMYINAGVFMIAGTETTATLLSGLTWLLCKNPEKMAKLCAELRGRFAKGEQVTAEALARLPYLNACLEEGLRLYPPLPIGPAREVCEGGNVICGEWIPGKTRVSVAQYAAYRSPLHFKDPDSFIPERWLPGTGHDDENRDILQPFSLGPRNCIGKNLAYYEMRVLTAKVLLNFDLKLCPQSAEWMNQKSYTLWEKHPLWITATPV
ncbi:Cytochrome P450 monooxygenase rdc4 [Lasiodiplodia hormozganensis]|uniref:Cytochrome P450 monooxygenase rdc4 n=1 Tax=Lasiodiplodia hormozganensis TaxID=869390 RepID=A0AA39XZR8_9PEZI|nr:Cytochrome P450 monooxygenase rdc4 [Lasiodiplodia hormozganensis]